MSAALKRKAWSGVRLLAALWLVLAATVAQGQTEIILDNGSAGFATLGTWPASTSVPGYYGANYQTHAAGGDPPGAVVLDNGASGFSVTGTWAASSAVAGFVGTNYQVHEANGVPPSALVLDNAQGTAFGTWPASTAVSGYFGANYQPHAAGTGSESFTWSAIIPAAGTYQVYARWTNHPNRATNAKYTVTHAAGSSTVTVNQQANGGTWQWLGIYPFNAGAATVSLTDEANGYVIADAVLFQPPGAAPNTASWSVGIASAGSYEVYARWTAHPNRASDAKYTITHAGGSDTVSVNQQANGGAWNLLGTYPYNPGAATVSLTDAANGYVIADALRIQPVGTPANSALWTPTLPHAGTYQVYARWTAHPNRASNARYTVTHAAGSSSVTVNQQANGGAWNLLGTYAFPAGAGQRITLTDEANGYVIADAIRLVSVNQGPAVAISAPANNASFTAPASIALSAAASDPDGSVQKVDFYQGATLIGTASSAPYSVTWAAVAPGSYSLTAVATDNSGAATTSAAVNVTVQSAMAQIYYIQVDHLNTPRLIADSAGTTVWKWDQQEPFGNDLPNDNPTGTGAFDFPLRFPGQYFDRETNLNYNYFRDYDPSIGRYVESDPIGLAGGVNTYAYVGGNPISLSDPTGEVAPILMACLGAAALFNVSMHVGNFFQRAGVAAAQVEAQNLNTRSCRPSNQDACSAALDGNQQRLQNLGTVGRAGAEVPGTLSTPGSILPSRGPSRP